MRTFGVGGDLSKPMMFSDFSGGMLYSLDRLLEDIDTLGLRTGTNQQIVDLLPKRTKLSTQFTFAIREAYPMVGDVPLEYRTSPNDDASVC